MNRHLHALLSVLRDANALADATDAVVSQAQETEAQRRAVTFWRDRYDAADRLRHQAETELRHTAAELVEKDALLRALGDSLVNEDDTTEGK